MQFYSSLALHKGNPSNKRSLQPSKDNIQHFKTWNLNFLVIFTLLDPDPAEDNQCGSGSGSGSQALLRKHKKVVDFLNFITVPVMICYASSSENGTRHFLEPHVRQGTVGTYYLVHSTVPKNKFSYWFLNHQFFFCLLLFEGTFTSFF